MARRCRSQGHRRRRGSGRWRGLGAAPRARGDDGRGVERPQPRGVACPEGTGRRLLRPRRGVARARRRPLLLERRLTLAVAESCTGGLLGHRLTNVPGSSSYFERGVLVYSNRAKEQLLGVPAEILRVHGAVSAPCAEAMARGICERAGTPRI